MQATSLHTFHIPVMGLAFSIDSPLKVARFGISSVLSLNDDALIEQMRQYYSQVHGEFYEPIGTRQPDFRAARITAYLDLLDKIVKQQVETLRRQAFGTDSDLDKYFSLLPESSPGKALYRQMLKLTDPQERKKAEETLRSLVQPGAIDVNIMTKVDKTNYGPDGEALPGIYSDALAALRGFARSTVQGSVVFSAGMNMRLFGYLEQFPEFLPNETGAFRKKVILKVSDYRSALVQGKILAKKGIWVSEFRIESGLNCGGHAFATDGFLLGPILEEFSQNRQALQTELFAMCQAALAQKGLSFPVSPPDMRLSVQGGIGTAAEQDFLLRHYHLDATGWGTPFLLVPEATTVDPETLQKLVEARAGDLYLSPISPLGVPFNALRGTSSEVLKNQRLDRGQPGSPCSKKYLVSNTEFTDKPVCTASRKYQKLKLSQLQEQQLPQAEYEQLAGQVLAKECLCDGLANSALQVLGLGRNSASRPVTICPGPNLAFFSGVFNLKEMVDHIYGRTNLLNSTYRPHMFVNELHMYVAYWLDLVQSQGPSPGDKQSKYQQAFKTNLLQGIAYYQALVPQICADRAARERMEQELLQCQEKLLTS